MNDLSLSNLVEMQNALQDRMKGKWLSINPENRHFSLLWMYEEMGKIVAIVEKTWKRGKNVRSEFIEELTDMLMYYVDLMTCYGVSAKQLSDAFITKLEKNIQRDFVKEHREYLSGDK